MSPASKAKNTQEAQIFIDNEEIECTSSLMPLGVHIDIKLSFGTHIQEVCQKANCKIGVLLRMKNLIPEKKKLHLLKEVILPSLNYHSLVLLFLRASDQQKLERIKEKGIESSFQLQCINLQKPVKESRITYNA